MNRKSFIRNTLMSFSIILLPKVLRPSDYEEMNKTGVQVISTMCDDYDWRRYPTIKRYYVSYDYYKNMNNVQSNTQTDN